MAGSRAELEQATRLLERVVAGFEPERLDADAALVFLSLFARACKVAEAGEALVARRIDACGAYRRSGHPSTAHLVAATAGVGLDRANTTVDVGKRLHEQSATDDSVPARRALTRSSRADLRGGGGRAGGGTPPGRARVARNGADIARADACGAARGRAGSRNTVRAAARGTRVPPWRRPARDGVGPVPAPTRFRRGGRQPDRARSGPLLPRGRPRRRVTASRTSVLPRMPWWGW